MFKITRLSDKLRGDWEMALFIRIDEELISYGRRMLGVWLDSCVMYN